MSYSVQNIRNVCLLGHSGSGKTALAESLIYITGAIDRMGRVADGNTVCDYDPEEVKRQISISTAVAPLEYKGCRINVLDTPGAFDFSGEVMEALRAADAAVIVCSAKDGISVGLEKAWKYCRRDDMPRFVYISKTDEENSDYNATFEALRERFGKKIAPVVVPIWDENKHVTGIIDVLNKRAFEMQDLKRVEIEIPEDKEAVITEFNDALKESVAETSEAFMDKFFSGEDFTYAEMIQGLRQGVRELSLFPVLCGSAVTCMGSLMLMDNIVDLLPNPMEGNYHKATRADGETEEFVDLSRRCADGLCVQDCFRPVWQVLLRQGPLRNPDAGSVHGQRPYRRGGEAGPPVYHARQKGHRGQGALLRRYRRHRQAGEGQDRRYPV